MTVGGVPKTGQDLAAVDVGLAVAIELANLADAGGGPAELRALFRREPVSVPEIGDADVEPLVGLAGRAAQVADLLSRGGDPEIDQAADLVNGLLEEFPAQLHLTKQAQGWTLHRHRPGAALVPAWSAVVAAAFARVIGDGCVTRVGSCPATNCGRYFYDLSKNNSRRYCSLGCQNRMKAAAYRSRKAG